MIAGISEYFVALLMVEIPANFILIILMAQQNYFQIYI